MGSFVAVVVVIFLVVVVTTIVDVVIATIVVAIIPVIIIAVIMIIIAHHYQYHHRHLYRSTSPSSSLKNLSPITFPVASSISPSLPCRSWEYGEHGCFTSKEFVLLYYFHRRSSIHRHIELLSFTAVLLIRIGYGSRKATIIIFESRLAKSDEKNTNVKI
jgi:hypothetical protein